MGSPCSGVRGHPNDLPFVPEAGSEHGAGDQIFIDYDAERGMGFPGWWVLFHPQNVVLLVVHKVGSD